jgi:hypothetical protein
MAAHAPIAVVVGLLCAGTCFLLASRAASIDEQLKEFETEKVTVSRWVTESFGSYRPEGWPLLTRLRFYLGATYLLGIAGVCLLMYGCPGMT